MADAARRAFVCGHPIAHSRSPKIHGYWLKSYGIAGSYEAVDIAPDDFGPFLAGAAAGGFAGGNVTIPHKEAAFRLVEHHDPAAEEIGAVNTVWFAEGRLRGANTDAYGFAANLDQLAPGWDTRAKAALVLGAGGASRAVIYALKARGFGDIRLVNRTIERAQELAATFGPKVSAHPLAAAKELASDVNLIVNTTSLGMHGQGDLPVDVEHAPDDALVTDLVYVPLETPLLAAARRRGLKTVDGLGMLLHQATPGFERWFGKKPEVTDELRSMIVADIGGNK